MLFKDDGAIRMHQEHKNHREVIWGRLIGRPVECTRY